MVTGISIILVLISIGTIVGPIGAVAVIYHDDLTQLVITPQIRDIINGDSTILPIGHSDNGNSNDNSGLESLMKPVFVSAQIDEAANTFTGVFNITNSLNYDLTLNSFSTDAVITQGNIPAGSISLSSPVTVLASQTEQLIISGHWTQQAQNYIISNIGAASVDITLTNIAINVNGITIQSAEPIQVSVPMNVQW